MNGYKKAAVFCVIASEDHFLLLKRSRNPNMGKYVPPGGKIEAYESPLAAMKREIREETGIDGLDLKICGVLTETSPTEYNWISYIYYTKVQHFTPPICEEGDFYWISKDNLANTDIPSTDMFIYQYIEDQKPFIFHAHFDHDHILLDMVEELTGEVLFKK